MSGTHIGQNRTRSTEDIEDTEDTETDRQTGRHKTNVHVELSNI